MKLDRIIEGLKIKEIIGSIDLASTEIDEIIYDSRKSKEGKLFTALTGYIVDGHKYVDMAYEKGVRAFLIESRDKVNIKEDAIYIVTDNNRIALSKISDNFFESPSKEMTVIGITGTKGKTTVSHFIRDILRENGKKVGILGTIGCFYEDYSEPTVNTTPESYEIHRIMRQMLNRGFNYMVMEISSGGIMNHRVDDIDFDYGIFLNLSLDHVGTNEHPSFEHYRNCKAELFRRCKISILNEDDDAFDFFKENSRGEVYTYSLKNKEADFYAYDITEGKTLKDISIRFKVKEKSTKEIYDETMPYPGIYNVYNALASTAVSRLINLSTSSIQKAMTGVRVNGRFDVYRSDNGVTFIIDYAHNGASIRSVLDTIKEHNPGKIYLVVGSVGGRTEGRRYEIGEASRDSIDAVVLTSDNQDFDNPLDIINEMKIPFKDTKVDVYEEVDRKKAIEYAFSMAKDNDVILVAGKGHETYNLENGVKIPYSDHEVVKEIINNHKL